MTAVNHRRKNRAPVALRYDHYDNGYSSAVMSFRGETSPSKHEIETADPTRSYQRVGRTRFLDKSLHAWGRKSEFADVTPSASISNDFSNGHRGMAAAVRGAKKYVRSRVRAKEKMKVREIFGKGEDECPQSDDVLL